MKPRTVKRLWVTLVPAAIVAALTGHAPAPGHSYSYDVPLTDHHPAPTPPATVTIPFPAPRISGPVNDQAEQLLHERQGTP